MDIEAIVKKHTNKTGWAFAHDSCEKSIRAALTELAAGYEQKQALLLDAHCERVISLQERISQLEAERVPEGWKLVPIEPTPEMVDAVLRYANVDDLQFYGANVFRKEISGDWAIMLAAAPQPEEGAQP